MISTNKLYKISFVIFFTLLFFSKQSWAVLSSSQSTSESASFVPGQVIVELKDDVLLTSSITTNTNIPSTVQTLIQLKSKYPFQKATPLIQSDILSVSSNTTSSSRSTSFYDKVISAFPQRALRGSHLTNVPDLARIYLLDFGSQADVQILVNKLSAEPTIRAVYPNYICKLAEYSPNDPYYSSQGSWGQLPGAGDYEDMWALKQIHPKGAWKTTLGDYVSGPKQGQSVVVATIDTGVDYNHPDIKDNIWTNPTPGAAGSSYPNDVRGWNFVNNSNDPMDDSGHGTHVAGIIAAEGDNETGIIGVAPQVKIMPLKVFNSSGSASLFVIESAFAYAASHGADVINNSWGLASGGIIFSNGTSSFNNYIPFSTLDAMGIVNVFAAGNGGDDSLYFAFANNVDPKPIVVASTTPTDNMSFFSNFGNFVDVGAPGSGDIDPSSDIYQSYRNILSLEASECTNDICPPQLVIGGDYLRQAGTSMSTPFVSGVAALVLAAHNDFSTKEVLSVIRAGADLNTGISIKYNNMIGYGRVNASKAVAINSPCVAIIDSPYLENVDYFDTTSIQAIASCRSFDHYTLDYGEGRAPAQWTPISSMISDGAVSAILNTQVLTNDFYTIRLRVFNTEGQEFNAYRPIIVTDGITKQSRPDLIVTRIAVNGQKIGTSLSLPQGTPVTYSATVTNQGTAPAAASSLEFYMLEPSGSITPIQTVIDQVKVPTLEPGASATVTARRPFVLSVLGNNDIVAWVNPLNEVYESDESNYHGFFLGGGITSSNNYQYQLINVTAAPVIVNVLNGTLVSSQTSQSLPGTWSNSTITVQGPMGAVGVITGTFPNFQITNLSVGTYYALIDLNGHTVNYSFTITSSSPSSMSLNIPIDLVSPTIPSNLSARSMQSGILLSWRASRDVLGVEGYYIIRNGVNTAKTTATLWTDTGLTPGSTYKYQVIAYDSLGNQSGLSNTATSMAPAAIVKLLNGTLVNLQTQKSLTGTWTNSSITATGPFGVVGVNQQVFPNFQMDNLSAGAYKLKINLEGHMSKYSFIITEPLENSKSTNLKVPIDLIVPKTPGVLTAQVISSNNVKLSWTASIDEGAFLEYKIERNSKVVTRTTNTNFIDEKLNPGIYTYQVYAYDHFGNQSALSNQATATVTGPVIVKTLNGMLVNSQTGQALTIGSWSNSSMTVIGPSGSAQVNLLTFPNFEINNLPAGIFNVVINVGGSAYNYSFTLTSKSPQAMNLNIPINLQLNAQLPTAPGNLIEEYLPANGLSPNEVYLSWVPSANNSAVIGYTVVANGVNVANVLAKYALNWSARNVSPGTYSYQVFAYDAAGDHSGLSNKITVIVPYIISVSANAGGTISPTGSVGVNAGQAQIFTITSNTGYIVDVNNLLLDGQPVSSSQLKLVTSNTYSYSLSNVEANHTLQANFIHTYMITISISGTGAGAITCTGGRSCPSIVKAGTSEIFTATPIGTSTFGSWGGACAGAGTTSSPYTCAVIVNSDISASATFNGKKVSLPIKPV